MSTVNPADSWRGVASEEIDEFNPSVSGLLRRRSRRLLATLARPYRWQIALAAVLICIRSAAYLALPYLVGLGIDKGIRPGGSGNLTTLELIVAALLGALAINAIANYAFLRLSGRIGADLLFDLRKALFAHVQELSLSFYERYNSGRIISRLTSDIDALNELLATGLTSVITSLISVVAISVILIHLDARLGMVTLVAMPLVLVLTYWFRSNSARSYRAVRRAIVLVIVHYVEVPGREQVRPRFAARSAQSGDLRERQRPVSRRQHLVQPPRVDVRSGDQPARPAHHHFSAALRRLPRRPGPDDAGG